MNEKTTQAQTGGLGESLASDILCQKGYRIIRTNYHAGRWGEIDIIAQDGATLVFVEVKTRRYPTPYLIEESITPAKLNKLLKAIQHYLQTEQIIDQAFRLDVIALGLDADNRIIYQNHLINVTLS